MEQGHLAVLHPVARPTSPLEARALGLGSIAAIAAAGIAALSISAAAAQDAAGAGSLPVLSAVLKWLPLIFSGFLFNLLVSALSMALGTVLGTLLGLGLLSRGPAVRTGSWGVMQFFRNAPWLVVLFYVMFLIPFQFTLWGRSIPFPDWIKSVIGLALPVMANVAEIVRGGIQSIPLGQWESAESLAFSRRQTLWQIIVPQALKRMLPPWMNLYAILTMATPLIYIVGVQDALTMTRGALVAEARPDLLIPMYALLLLLFFAYCYPIALTTRALERRFDVKS